MPTAAHMPMLPPPPFQRLAAVLLHGTWALCTCASLWAADTHTHAPAPAALPAPDATPAAAPAPAPVNVPVDVPATRGTVDLSGFRSAIQSARPPSLRPDGSAASPPVEAGTASGLPGAVPPNATAAPPPAALPPGIASRPKTVAEWAAYNKAMQQAGTTPTSGAKPAPTATHTAQPTPAAPTPPVPPPAAALPMPPVQPPVSLPASPAKSPPPAIAAPATRMVPLPPALPPTPAPAAPATGATAGHAHPSPTPPPSVPSPAAQAAATPPRPAPPPAAKPPGGSAVSKTNAEQDNLQQVAARLLSAIADVNEKQRVEAANKKAAPKTSPPKPKRNAAADTGLDPNTETVVKPTQE